MKINELGKGDMLIECCYKLYQHFWPKNRISLLSTYLLLTIVFRQRKTIFKCRPYVQLL